METMFINNTVIGTLIENTFQKMGHSDQYFPNGLIKCDYNVSTLQIKHTKTQLAF